MVHEDDRQAAEVGGFLDGIARGAGDGRDDGAVVAEELVEQTGLARVGPAHDSGADAASQKSGLRRGAQQFVHELHAARESRDELVLGVGRDVFVGKIYVRFDVREGLDEVIAQEVDALGKFAGKLFVGGGEGEFGARGNQIVHGLGLREVNAAIEKCAAGEFAWLGEARAVFEHGVEDESRWQQSAVTGDFDDVLARQGARGAHHGDHDFIHGAVVAHDFAVVNGVRGNGV